jgi:2-dehydro-3-deoxy-D-arabinonate dehydratase
MALWKIAHGSGRWARGPLEEGPVELLPEQASLDRALATPDGFDWLREVAPTGPVPDDARVAAPLDTQPVWAAGVTYERTRQEGSGDDPYTRVYHADRPELFLKAAPGTSRGPGEAVGIRTDSEWNAPEPELTVVADRSGRVVAYTIGNDMSARSVEAENPLYLPQAKVYDASCAVGPCLVPVEEAPALDEMDITLEIAREGAGRFSASVGVSALRRQPDDLVSWLRRAQVFDVGVVLLTGTAIVPPLEWTLQAGDRVTVRITGLGALENVVRLAVAQME